jgi:hypothetical protein
MRKTIIILSLLFLATTSGICEAAQSPRQLRYYCLPGFKYCLSVRQCVPRGYPCRVPRGRVGGSR